MKRIVVLILICAVMVSAAACSDNKGGSTDQVTKILNSMEYSIYMITFQGDQASDYTNKTYTKEGIFSVLHDSYNDTLRYYVWGYADETLCCDWQWEFVPQDKDSLPPIGSHVKVTGKFVQSDSALDGYWMEDASVETVTEYKKGIGDYDTVTMSPTLTRVQVINMYNFATEYDGQPIKIYGRVMSNDSIQHPYYDGAWSMPLEYDGRLPAIGTYVTVTGKFSGSSPDDSKIIVESVEIE